jgi:hypothetical protein
MTSSLREILTPTLETARLTARPCRMHDLEARHCPVRLLLSLFGVQRELRNTRS